MSEASVGISLWHLQCHLILPKILQEFLKAGLTDGDCCFSNCKEGTVSSQGVGWDYYLSFLAFMAFSTIAQLEVLLVTSCDVL